jgi:hypothetical protein
VGLRDLMLLLAASDTIAGVADAASKVTVTMFGMELNGTTETYKALYQGQLSNSAGTVYTATANGPTFVRSIMVVNADTASHTFQLFRGGTAAGNAITPTITLPASYCAVYEDGNGWRVYSGSGEPLAVKQTAVYGVDNYGITNSKAETMDRNFCTEIDTAPAVTGVVCLGAIWLTAGTVVSNISVMPSATPTAPTHGFLALYNKMGTLLATGPDTTSDAWTVNVLKTSAMGTPYTVTVTDLYYIGWSLTGGGSLHLKGGPTRTNGNLSFTQFPICGASVTAYASGTAPSTVALPVTANTGTFWACVT